MVRFPVYKMKRKHRPSEAPIKANENMGNFDMFARIYIAKLKSRILKLTVHLYRITIHQPLLKLYG